MNFEERYKDLLDKCADPRFYGADALYFKRVDLENPIAIQGVPSSEALEMFGGSGGAVSKSRKPVFSVSIKSLQAKGIEPERGDSIEYRGIKVLIKDIDQDGEGCARFYLGKGGA